MSSFTFVSVGSLICADWIVISEASVLNAFSSYELGFFITITKSETFIDKSVTINGTNKGSGEGILSIKFIVANLAIIVCSFQGSDRQKEK